MQVQFEPPRDLDVIDRVADMGIDSVGIHVETFDPQVLARVAPGKARWGIDAYFAAWERAVAAFGEGQVSTYVILGMGEDAELDRRGLQARDRHRRLPVRRAAAAGAGQPDGGPPPAAAGGRRGRLPPGRRPTWRTRACRPPASPPAAPAARPARAWAPSSARDGRRLGDGRPFAPALRRSDGSTPRLPAGAGRRPSSACSTTAIRREVFVAEQGLFDGSTTRDAYDDDPATVHVLGFVDGEPAGTVRLYPLTRTARSGRATGWRCCREYRRTRHRRGRWCASRSRWPASAAAPGWWRHVQVANVAFFEHLGWSPIGEPADYLGVPHQRMSIALAVDAVRRRPAQRAQVA